MTKSLVTGAALVLLAGCTPLDFTRPTFPAVPPAKAEAAKPEPAAKGATPKRGPITASQVNDRNARDMLQALEAELDADATQ